MALNDLVVGIGGDNSAFKKSLGGVTGGIRGMQAVTTKATGAMRAAFTGVVTSLGPIAAALGIFATAKKSISLAAEFESTKAALGTLLGDFDAAETLLGRIEQFSASTPFQMDELSGAARGLIAFGRSADQAMGDLRVLGDIAAGTNKPIDDFVQIFGKVRSTGKASMEEVNRLAERGVPIYAALAETLGVGQGEIQKLVSAGKVGFPELNSALKSTTAEGGKFFGGMETQSQTLAGAWSTLKDNIFLILKDIGGAVIEAFGFKEALTSTTSMAQSFRQNWLPTIKSALTTAGNIFRAIVGFMKGLWNGFIGSAVKEIVFVAENWKLFAQIAWERIKIFASNAWERIKTFFANWGEMLRWLGANWPALLKDMTAFTVQAAKNMAANVGEFFKSVLDFAKGKGFKPKFTSLTDGFQSSLKELPNLTKANVKESTAELDRLYGEAAKRRIEFGKRFSVGAGDPNDPINAEGQAQTGAGAQSLKPADFQPLSSTETGTAEAFAKIFGAIGGAKQKGPEDKTADNTAAMKETLGELKRLWEKLERKLGNEKVFELLG